MSFWSSVARAPQAEPFQVGEWNALFGQTGTGAGIPLGTARWTDPEAAIERFRFPETNFGDRFFIGEGFDWRRSSLGYADDRHVCLVSGSRGGKGVGVIVPNLCIWPGSCIVVDPKGENATVTARRRGAGSEYAIGLGQKVCILDPYGEVQLPAELKARYNPLDAIDPTSDFAVDDAARIAAALVVVESRTDPYWELAGRNLIKGLILHVLSAPYLAKARNLVMVRRLLTQGDWLTLEKLRNSGINEDLPSTFELLWSQMRKNPAFNGVVAGVGEQMIAMADKQRSGVLEAARTNTEFLDSTPMQRMLEVSDFDLGELKTNPQGLTIYLTLPQRFMETHYRWLRLMITLAVGEMERIKGRTATGHPTLFVMDEFAGLKRMEVIENAAAQAAGMGIKFLFVIQNLAQLNEIYEKSWETFFGNSGLKLFFQIDDDFSRSYLSRQLGELETLRQTQSGSQSRSTNRSTSEGQTFGTNSGWSSGVSRGRNAGVSLNYSGLFRIFSKTDSRQTGANRSTSYTRNWGRSKGTSYSTSDSFGDSTTSGWGEGVHKRPLLNPDEIGRLLARVDDRGRPGYPGLVLALVPGEYPVLTRRVNYFESERFLGYFDPHPNHPSPPTLAELAQRRSSNATLAAPARHGWSAAWWLRRLATISVPAAVAALLVIGAIRLEPFFGSADTGQSAPSAAIHGYPLPATQLPSLSRPAGGTVISTGAIPDSIAFSPDGHALASASSYWLAKYSNETLRLWDAASGRLQRVLFTAPTFSGFYSVSFSPDGRMLASGADNDSTQLWDVTSGRLVRTLFGDIHTDDLHTIKAVAFSPDGHTLAAGGADGIIRLFDVANGKRVGTLSDSRPSGHTDEIASVAFSPDGHRLASGSWDNRVKLWDVATGKLVRTLSGHSHNVYSIAFSPDGHVLASSGDDGIIQLWDAENGQLWKAFIGPEKQIHAIAFSPDGRMLASGTYSNTIEFFDVASGALLQRLTGHTGPILSLAFSSDGQTLVSGSGDQTIRLWDVENVKRQASRRSISSSGNSSSSGPQTSEFPTAAPAPGASPSYKPGDRSDMDRLIRDTR